MSAVQLVQSRPQSEFSLRGGRPDDAPACDRIIYDAFHAIADRHGFARDFPSAEVATGLAGMLHAQPGQYSVAVERARRVTGYATIVDFFGHAVAETNDDLKALIGAAPSFAGPEAMTRKY